MTTEPLFRRFAALPADALERSALRDRLIRLHLPLADHIARRFAHRGEPLDDLVQVARLALVKTVDRFDPDRGVAFLGYAIPTITGEVRRHFRDTAWYVRVPRRLQELHLALNAATEELSARDGRAPTARTLAAHLGLEPALVFEALTATNAYRPAALDAPVPIGTGSLTAPLGELLGGADPAVERAENHIALAHLLTELSDRDRRILGLRFFEGRTQTQIAQEIGVSQMQVSRLLAAILARLRRGMAVSA